MDSKSNFTKRNDGLNPDGSYTLDDSETYPPTAEEEERLLKEKLEQPKPPEKITKKPSREA